MLMIAAAPEFFYSEPEQPSPPRGGNSAVSPPGRHESPRGLSFELAPQARAFAEPVATYRVTIHSTTNCPQCERLKERLIADPRFTVELAAINSVPAGVPLNHFPFITFRDATGLLRYNDSARSADQVVDCMSRAGAKPSNNVDDVATSTDTAAGLINGRGVIKSGLDWWSQKIGGATVTASWNRNGGQTFPLLKMGSWTAKQLYGSNGSFEFRAAGKTSLPVQDALLRYRLVGDKLRLSGETEIPASLLGIDTTPKAVESSQAVGLIDPISILSIASLVWTLLHPQCDVTLPGTVSASASMTDGVLAIRFTDKPSLRIVMLFAFNLSVESVTISESQVTLHFSGSRWIKQKTFEVR